MLETKRTWPLSYAAIGFFAGAVLMSQAVSGQDAQLFPATGTFVPAVDAEVIVLKGEAGDVADAVTSIQSISISGDNGWVATDDFTFAFPAADDLSYLDWPNVQQELELAEDQLRKVQKAREASFKATTEFFMAQQKADKQLSPEAIQEFMAKTQQKVQETMDEVLLPHQQRRLKQVALQMRMEQQGVSGALMSKEVVEALGISDEQRKQMQKTARDAGVEISKEMKRLRAEARQKVMAQLSETQRKKLKELTGDDMKNRSPSFTAAPVSTDEK